MKKPPRLISCLMAAVLLFTAAEGPAQALEKADNPAPAVLTDGNEAEVLPEESTGAPGNEDEPETVIATLSMEDILEITGAQTSMIPERTSLRTSLLLARKLYRMAQENGTDLAVCRVSSGHVWVRQAPNKKSAWIGKIYRNGVASVLGKEYTENGLWYHIQSGSVDGYVKSEYFVTGVDALSLYDQIVERFVEVREGVQSLRLRDQPGTGGNIMTTLNGDGQRYEYGGTENGWVKVVMDDTVGYVSAEYCNIIEDVVTAVSREEEEEQTRRAQEIMAEYQRRMAEAESSRQAMLESLLQKSLEDEYRAIIDSSKAADQNWEQRTWNHFLVPGEFEWSVPAGTSEIRAAICYAALEYIGILKYEWGGTSLTMGADCSGFTQQIFRQFGISIPRNSSQQGRAGVKVDSMQDARPGDIVHYDGHVGIFLGYQGGVPLFVHCSSDENTVKVSRTDYRTVCCIRNVMGD